MKSTHTIEITLLCVNFTDLCSSMLYPDPTENILQHILHQVATGNTHSFYSNNDDNDALKTPTENQSLAVSRILPDKDADDTEDNRTLPATTPDGELELSLDVDGLVLQPSPMADEPFLVDDGIPRDGNMDPKLLYEFKAAMCKNKMSRITEMKTPDHLQSTPIAGNIKGIGQGKNKGVKKCLMPPVSPVTSPPRFVEVEEENCQKQAVIIKPQVESKETEEVVEADEELEVVKEEPKTSKEELKPIKEELKPLEELKPVEEVDVQVQVHKVQEPTKELVLISQVAKDLTKDPEAEEQQNGVQEEHPKSLEVQIPDVIPVTKAEPEDLSPLSEACFNLASR